ncbi:hypothetical protein JOB18_014961 [Solea senegalensis]|uniref:Uncharacterized protein n=1 Tax=Solea senegalensis TaxID=28829 RepID=A0AAV6QNG4_SOLSE|nr:hypothetical protein JOB18_014961 [Solea senegalensis]
MKNTNTKKRGFAADWTTWLRHRRNLVQCNTFVWCSGLRRPDRGGRPSVVCTTCQHLCRVCVSVIRGLAAELQSELCWNTGGVYFSSGARRSNIIRLWTPEMVEMQQRCNTDGL